jgi:hypothetical protein
MQATPTSVVLEDPVAGLLVEVAGVRIGRDDAVVAVGGQVGHEDAHAANTIWSPSMTAPLANADSRATIRRARKPVFASSRTLSAA